MRTVLFDVPRRQANWVFFPIKVRSGLDKQCSSMLRTMKQYEGNSETGRRNSFVGAAGSSQEEFDRPSPWPPRPPCRR